MLTSTSPSSLYSAALTRFSDQQVVTIATGATCAYLGDERNLREFLVADETARWLRRAGHTVIFYLIDDSMDPLNARQLRVAVNKDEKLIARFEGWCGKPISQLPDPWGCHESYSAHFEEELVGRLHRLDCHPTLVTTAKLYERGVYDPYIRIATGRSEEILAFLKEKFPTYTPDKLFWPLCPACRYIDQTSLLTAKDGTAIVRCERCERTSEISCDELEGKLNWKLDCAARWAIFNIQAEPFSKNYLEPQCGSFVVAQSICRHFFGGPEVMPLHYGTFKMENKWGGKLLDSMPASAMRRLFTENPSADFKVTRDLMITMASRTAVLPGLTYLDFVKQMLPMWLLQPEKLTPAQRDLVANGVAFSLHLLGQEVKLSLPSKSQFEGERLEVLNAMRGLLTSIVALRAEKPDDAEMTQAYFEERVKFIVETLGAHKGPVLGRLRRIVGQEQGLPASKFLYILPLPFLNLLEEMLSLYLAAQRAELLDLENEEREDDESLIM